jgi:hypothetical protein
LITLLLYKKCRSFCSSCSSFHFRAATSHRRKYIPLRCPRASSVDVPAVM